MARQVKSVVTLDTQGFESGINREVRGIDRLISSMKQANSHMKLFTKPLKLNLNSSDAISRIKSVGSQVKSLTSRSHRVTLHAMDKVSSTIGNVKSKLVNLKTLAAGIVLGGATVGLAKATLGGASSLQQEQIAMKHFIGNAAVNKGKDVQQVTDKFIQGLRQEANVSPFGTNEVIEAGRRAVNVVQGDTGKAMELVKLSEDMAALNPGKSVMDAMEALADMKTGEFERMKEFGFKFSAAQLKGMVGKGEKDNLSDSEMDKAYSMLVRQKLNPTFKGGSQKLSESAAGKGSTVEGNIESMLSNLGTAMLPNVDKTLTPLIKTLERFERSKAFESLKKNLGQISDTIGTNIVKFLEDLEKHPEKIDQAFAVLGDTFTVIGDILSTVGAVAKEVWPLIKPILEWIKDNPDIAAKLFVGFAIGVPVLTGLIGLFSGLKKGIEGAADAFKFFKKLMGKDKEGSDGGKKNKKSKSKSKTSSGSKSGSKSPSTNGRTPIDFSFLDDIDLPDINKKKPKPFNVKTFTKNLNIPKTIKLPAPKLSMPQLKLPKTNIGKFKLPKISLPKIPKMPKIKAPVIPKIKAPKLPKLKMPKLTVPKLNFGSMTKGFGGVSKGIGGMSKAFSVFKLGFKAVPVVGQAMLMVDACNGLKTAYDTNFLGIKDMIGSANTFIEGKLSGFRKSMESTAKTSGTQSTTLVKNWDTVRSAFAHPIQAIVNYVKTGSVVGGDVQASTPGGGKSGNKKAMGQRYIPYDEYPIIAHQGERILTASEARRYDSGRSESAISIKIADSITVRSDADIDKITDALVQKLKRARFNMA